MSDPRIVFCEHCQSEGRILRSDGGPDDIDHGECPACDGTGGEIVETQPITLDDLDAAENLQTACKQGIEDA